MIDYFARHPTAANLLMLLFIVLGLSALPALQRETFPDFSAVEVEARVVYPGATANEVEEALCQRLEDAVDSISDVLETRCEAREGLATLVVKMRPGGEFGRFLDDVKTEVEAIDTFPGDAEAPVIRELNRVDRVISVAVTGPMPDTHLKVYAEELRDRLKALPQVSQVTLQGFSERQLRIQVPELVLRQYGLGIDEIADAVRRQSLDRPAGVVETREREVLIRFAEERRSPRELADLVVIGANDTELRLGDIATVIDRFELDEARTVVDGARAAILQVTKTRDEDTLTVVEAVRDFVARERALAPPGVAFILTQDVASIVADRLRLLVSNGLQGLVLVFLTLWLFFRLRVAFWVSAGLPVAFLGGMLGMVWLGLSINMMTMVALLMALGLLMDDAIVIAENVAAHRERGEGALASAVNGTREVAPGVLASFLTTVVVFGPLTLLAGDIGRVLKVLPQVLIMVLAVSLVEAFLILPRHLAHAQRHASPPGRGRRAFEAGLERAREALVGRAVDGAIRHRYLFAGGVMAVFLISVGMLAGGHLGFRAFPDLDGDVIEARLLLPQGTPLWRTEARVAEIVTALETLNREYTPRQPDGQSLVRHLSVRYGENPDAFESGPHVATVSVDLRTAEERVGRVDDMLARWRELVGPLPDAISLVFQDPQIGPGGRDLEIRLHGLPLPALQAASRELRDWLGRYRGVSDLGDDLRPGKPELRLRLREGAYTLGLDASTIAGQLQGAFQGITVAEIQAGGEDFQVDLQLDPADQDSLADLGDFWITTRDGRQVPLLEVAVLAQDRGFARIQRIDGRPTVTITGQVKAVEANANRILTDTRARFLPDLYQRYPGLVVGLEGQAREGSTTGASLARNFLLGLVGIFLLLSFQFRSFVEPLAVMVVIPLALIGVVWGHWLLGLELSMPSMMGFVSLAGIVVNDSILLVEFLKRRQREGLSMVDAARRASRERFRAVLLTSATTVAGLLPLLFERSLQAQVLIPLVTSVVFGLLATTLLVLLVVPVLFAILADLGWSARPEETVEQNFASLAKAR